STPPVNPEVLPLPETTELLIEVTSGGLITTLLPPPGPTEAPSCADASPQTPPAFAPTYQPVQAFWAIAGAAQRRASGALTATSNRRVVMGILRLGCMAGADLRGAPRIVSQVNAGGAPTAR